MEGYRIYRSRDGAWYEEIGRVGPKVDHFVDTMDRDGGTYRYRVLTENQDNWHETATRLRVGPAESPCPGE